MGLAEDRAPSLDEVRALRKGLTRRLPPWRRTLFGSAAQKVARALEQTRLGRAVAHEGQRSEKGDTAIRKRQLKREAQSRGRSRLLRAINMTFSRAVREASGGHGGDLLADEAFGRVEAGGTSSGSEASAAPRPSRAASAPA